MSRYCPDCGYVIIPKEFIDHNDSCRCGELHSYETVSSAGSCIEATLRHSIDMNVPRSLSPRTLNWTGRIDSIPNMCLSSSYFKYDFSIMGTFLYIFDRSQGGQCVEECYSPRLFGQILRKYIDDVDNQTEE